MFRCVWGWWRHSRGGGGEPGEGLGDHHGRAKVQGFGVRHQRSGETGAYSSPRQWQETETWTGEYTRVYCANEHGTAYL